MDPQFDTNMTTWYVIIPILIIGLAVLIWFILRIKTTILKRVTLIIISSFALLGFTTTTLAVYYQFNEPFAAMFKFYAYSKLAPDDDPFVQANDYEGKIIKVLGVTEVYKEDGQIRLPNLDSYFDFDYAGYLFTRGKWQTVKVDDHIMTVQDADNDGQLDIINTSLWWALTKDPYKLTQSVE